MKVSLSAENVVCLQSIPVQGLLPADLTLVCVGRCSTSVLEVGSLKSKFTTVPCFASEGNFSITAQTKGMGEKSCFDKKKNCTLLASHAKQFLSWKSALNEVHN